MTKLISALMLSLSLAFAMIGCAGMRAYPTGIRADQGYVFYANLKMVAQKRNMKVSDHDRSVNVRTDKGDWLQFMTKKDVIELVVIPETERLSAPQIAERQEELRKLGDELIAEAKQMARDASALDAPL